MGWPQKHGNSVPKPPNGLASKTSFSTPDSLYYARFGQLVMGLKSVSAISTPQDYNFLARSNVEFHHVRLSPMLPWPQTLQIGFMLPNRSAGASRFWKLGYLSLSRALSLSSSYFSKSCNFNPHGMMAAKNNKIPILIRMLQRPQNTYFRPPNLHARLVLSRMPSV